MRLLILGGTDFLGRHVVEAALARRMRVTLFNRGRTNPELFPGVEKLRGNRDGELHALRGRAWDAVVDTSGYFPRSVWSSARLLATAAHYTYISSISVYANASRPGTDESAPLHAPADDDVREVTADTYGPLKAACEDAAEQAMPGRVLIVRAGLLVGPHDNVPRFPYWMRRVAAGGEVLAPGRPRRPVQLIDARDVADWILTMAEQRVTGVFNVAGRPGQLTFLSLLEACRDAVRSEAHFAWVDDEVLLREGVEPFDGLPYWVPEHAVGVMHIATEKARAHGLHCRPFEETAADTWAWLRVTQPEEPPLSRIVAGIPIVCGIPRSVEAHILRRFADPQVVPRT
jgi:2'-hydroxyisoflavone reductase